MRYVPMSRMAVSLWETCFQQEVDRGLTPIAVMLAEGRMFFPFLEDDDDQTFSADIWWEGNDG